MSKASKENPNAFKHIYDKNLLELIAQKIKKVYPAFSEKEFKSILKQMLTLEMKARVYLIRDKLHELLPQDFVKSSEILLKSTEDGTLTGFAIWPYTEFVQSYGLEHVKESLRVLKELTKLFTSEWAVRPFLKKDFKTTYNFLKTYTKDENAHVRRWVSEGTRPRLPWGQRLGEFIKKPDLSFELLDKLKFDSELYVRKSVANHLNDLTKDHPDKVVDILSQWNQQAKKPEDIKNIQWITKHALRTLIKEGHGKALSLLGVNSKVAVNLKKLKLHKKEIKLGEHIDFSFELISTAPKEQSLIIDYIVHFMKANGKTAPKVFKLKNIHLKANQKILIQKKHPIKPITTRTYYAGQHHLEIQVNGNVYLKESWRLKI